MKSGPLMCWDIYMEGYRRRSQSAQTFTEVKMLAEKLAWRTDWDLQDLLLRKQRIVVVTDVEQVIRYASPNMLSMNGYQPKEVVGKKPKMFQGPATCPNTRNEIKEAIVRRIPFKGELVNYRKNGTTYNCLVEEYPVWDRRGDLVNFIAFEKIA